MEQQDLTRDAASVVADMFGVSAHYVRMIVDGTREANSDNAKAIKKAYKSYIREKKKLIKGVKKSAKS